MLTETFNLFGHEITIQQGMITLYVTVILLFIFMFYVRHLFKKKKSNRVESNIEMIIIMLMDFLADIPKSFLGEERGKKFVSLSITLYLLIFVSNTLVIFGLREAATVIAFPLTLAVIMFVFWTCYGIAVVGPKSYVKDLFEPIPIMMPIEIIGRIAMPLSMGMRLFGNIFSGFLIMGLLWIGLAALINSSIIGAIFGFAGGAVFGSALTFYFSIFAPFIQALVFTSLTMSNINSLVEE